MPVANYLTNTKPPIPIDWSHDAEIAYEYGMERILRKLDETRPFIFVDKVEGQKDAFERADGHYKSTLTKHVMENWNKQEGTHYYDVYTMD